MKICNILLCLNPGGAENVAAKLSNIWSKQGHDVSVILFVNNSYPIFYHLDSRVKVINLDIYFQSKNFLSSIINNLKRILLIRKHFKFIKPDIIIAHCSREITLSFFANLFLNFKLIGYIHSNPKNITKEKSIMWKFLTYVSFSLINHCIVFSENSKKYLPVLAKKKSMSFLNLYTENQNMLSPNYNLKNIIIVGSFIEVKNHIIIFKIFSKILKNFPDWTLTIVGDGPLKNEYQKIITYHNIDKNIFFPGTTEDVYSYYNKASIFILPSLSEGLSLSLMEASSFGLPCIISDCSESHNQIIIHDKNGYIYKKNSSKELYNFLINLISNEDLRKKFGNFAIKNSLKFSNKKTIDKWSIFLKNES